MSVARASSIGIFSVTRHSLSSGAMMVGKYDRLDLNFPVFSFKAGKYFQTAGTAEPGVQVSPRCPEAGHMLLSVEPWRDAAQEPLGIKQGSCAADVGYRWAKGKYERFAAQIGRAHV